jgi:hypothetical protein
MRAACSRAATTVAALAIVAPLAACGPYAEVAQKLDVTTPITSGETWIAVAGPDRSELRVLVVGAPPEGGSAEFSLTTMQMPISAGTSATALQGTWREETRAGTATFTAARQYTLPDERGTPLLARRGVWRADVSRVLGVTVARAGGLLVLAGDPTLAGTYVRFRAALAALGASTARDAACAFQLSNLGIRSSEVRIIGFGGPGMTQYQTAATYVGTLAGSLRVSEQGFLDNTTTITYSGFVDLGGVRVDGPQITDADSGGNGQMSGTLAFALEPLAADGSVPPPITGTIDYGGAGNPADAVQISSGFATGGAYVIVLAGGGAAKVSPATAPSPSVAECLALP